MRNSWLDRIKSWAWKVLNIFTCCYVKCKMKMIGVHPGWAWIFFLWDHIWGAVSCAGLPIARKTLRTAGNSVEGHGDDWGWSTCPVSRGWGSYAVQTGKRRLRGHLTAFLNYWMGGYWEYGGRLLQRKACRWHILWLVIRKKIFTIKVFKYWNRGPERLWNLTLVN